MEVPLSKEKLTRWIHQSTSNKEGDSEASVSVPHRPGTRWYSIKLKVWKPGLTQKYFSIVTKRWNSTPPEVTKYNILAKLTRRHQIFIKTSRWLSFYHTKCHVQVSRPICNCCKPWQEPAWKTIGRFLNLVLTHLAQVLSETEENLVLKLNE